METYGEPSMSTTSTLNCNPTLFQACVAQQVIDWGNLKSGRLMHRTRDEANKYGLGFLMVINVSDLVPIVINEQMLVQQNILSAFLIDTNLIFKANSNHICV